MFEKRDAYYQLDLLVAVAKRVLALTEDRKERYEIIDGIRDVQLGRYEAEQSEVRSAVRTVEHHKEQAEEIRAQRYDHDEKCQRRYPFPPPKAGLPFSLPATDHSIMKTLLVLTLCSACLLTGRLSAQVPQEPAADRLVAAEAALDLKASRYAFDPKDKRARGIDVDRDAVVTILDDSTKDPAALRSIVGNYVMRMAASPETGVGPRLAAVQVLQNARIIALLETIAAAKK